MGVREVSAAYSAMQGAGVPKGYKQTEVGVIPEDWEAIPLESVTPLNVKNGIVDGPFGSNLKTIHYRSAGIPIITSGYVTNGRFYAESYLYVDKEKFLEEKRSAVSPGDIVMAKIGERCGASAILPSDHERGILSGNALKISVDNSRYSTFYVWQYLWMLHTSGGMELLRTVGAQPALSMANLKKHKIPVPHSKLEQNAIAEALSDADALIESLDQLLTKKRQLKQGAIQELLTGKKRMPGSSEEWGNVRFGDIVYPRKERIDRRQSGVHEFCVELEHLGQGTGELLGHTIASIDSSLKSVFYKGDVLFGKLRAYLKKYWRADRDGVCSTEIWVLTPKNSAVLSSYLFQIVMVDDFIEVASSAYGTHMPRSDWNVVKNYELPIPNVEEQSAIATILSDMDAELATLEEKLVKAHATKQGMMQELLTGAIRLIHSGTAAADNLK